MSLRTARLLVAAYLVLMAVAVTWPMATLTARIDPMVLGLPFSFFWLAAWVAVAVPVLYLLDRVEARHRAEGDTEGHGRPPPDTPVEKADPGQESPSTGAGG